MFAGGACTPDGGDGSANSEMASISVNPASFAVDLEGGEQTIAVTSNGTWVATCLEGDVVITPATGSGDGSVVVTVPTTTAARNFVVKFDVSKQTLIAGTDMVSTTKASAEVTVSQNATGTDANDYLFYEDCGEDVEKNAEGYWPYIDQFEGWNPQGDIAADVTYAGKNASVRASGGNYQPTADAVGVSGQPYVFLNKVPAEAYFVIENLAVTGGANYIFTFNVSCQNGYSGTPSFATVDNSLVHLELGYDGENWDAVECTYAANGGNGWYAATAQFKVAADATKVYARFSYEAPASNGGGRFDDFKLVEGGTGAELAPEAPVVNQGTIADITAAGNYTVKGAWAVATYANGCLLTDNSGAYILAYNPTVTPAVGEVVDIEGAVSEYAKLLQFGAGSVVTKTGETKTVTHPTAEVLDGAKMDAYLGTPVIKYVEYSGVLSISSGKYYNVTVPGASTSQGSVAYPGDDIKATLTSLDGKGIKVTGYLIGVTSSKYVNTMAVSVEETTVEMPETPDTPDTPEIPAEGTGFMSDAAFVDSSENYNGNAKINGSTEVNSSGFKLGTSKLAGYFASKAVGVAGDLTLEFYAVAWKGKSATLYVRKQGSTELLGQFALKANDGATGNPVYTMTLTDGDHYSINVPGVTADTVLEFSTDASFTKVDNTTSGRAIVVGAHLK